MPDDDDLLTYAQAAQPLGVSVRTISRWVSAGTLPVVRLGHRTSRIRQSDLAAFIDQHKG